MGGYDNFLGLFIGLHTFVTLLSILYERVYRTNSKYNYEHSVGKITGGWSYTILPDMAYYIMRCFNYGIEAFTNLYVIMYPMIALAGSSAATTFNFGTGGDSVGSDQGFYILIVILAGISSLATVMYPSAYAYFFGAFPIVLAGVGWLCNLGVFFVAAIINIFTLTSDTATIRVLFFVFMSIRIAWSTYITYVSVMAYFKAPPVPPMSYKHVL